jgi:hypothetical protein
MREFAGYFRMRGGDPTLALHQAQKAIYGMLQQQAAMLSFVEAFKLMSLVFFCLIPFVALLRDPKKERKQKAPTASAAELPDPSEAAEIAAV